MKQFYIFIAMLLLLSISVSAYYCYQESPNIPDQSAIDGSCLLNYAGNYSYFNGSRYVWDYYMKPLYSDNNSLWQFKTGFGNSTIIQENIPSSCWNFNDSTVFFQMESYHNPVFNDNHVFMYCENSSGYQKLYSQSNSLSVGFDISGAGWSGEIMDGNYSTYQYYIGAPTFTWSHDAPLDSNTWTAVIYDDAMNWSITPPCIENWIMDSNVCMNNSQLISFHDANSCGTYTDIPLSNGTMTSCSSNNTALSTTATILIVILFFIAVSIALGIALHEAFFAVSALLSTLLMSYFIYIHESIYIILACAFMILLFAFITIVRGLIRKK